MPPTIRRLAYVVSFEAGGVLLGGTGLMMLSGAAIAATGIFAFVSSLIAVFWNFLYNTGFEAWESAQAKRGRSLLRRIGHVVGLEAGLVAILTPLMAWWLEIPFLDALLYDLILTSGFLAYAFLFSLAFDAVFGLPSSAR